jgi:hypothetical protein
MLISIDRTALIMTALIDGLVVVVEVIFQVLSFEFFYFGWSDDGSGGVNKSIVFALDAPVVFFALPVPIVIIDAVVLKGRDVLIQSLAIAQTHD